MTDRKALPGKFAPFPMGSATYEMIYAGATPDTMVAGYSPSKSHERSHWRSYVSVEDVDAAAKTAAEIGGKVVSA